MIHSALRRGALLGALCAAILAALLLFDAHLFGAEWSLFDAYSRLLARSRRPDPRIVLVTVSDAAAATLAETYGRPQSYSREVYARVLDELRRDGAAVVAFDIFFAEPNDAAPEGDRAFAEKLAGANAVLAAQTQPPNARRPLRETPEAWRAKLLPKSTVAAFNLEPPHITFRDAAAIGTIRLATSGGSARIHHYPLADPLLGASIPSLGLATADRFLHRDVARGGEMLIRWNGAKRTPEALSYPSVDLDKLVIASLAREEGTIDAATLAQFAKQFRGKIVLVGFTSAGLLDLRANPLSPKAAGIEIHANAVDNMINGDANREASLALTLPLILLIGAAFGAAIDSTRSQLFSGLIAVSAVALVLAAGYAALAVAHLATPAFSGAAAVALTYVVITVVKFVAEQQQSALLRATFGRYVSPQILEHILAHPEKVRLGGERRDLTILFSDIRGFTSISEASEPEEVVEMLNEYLTRMVDILLAHGGTLDKFIGDAVMGFWNAPAFDANHARNAVACAVAMVEETARLRAQWEAEGKAALRIGIGINTGDAVVGNIGSGRVFSYTVIGDAVNLASRLESKNKDYVTEIIISEFTLARIGDSFETVYLDDVKVKGKERAVKIYQVPVKPL
ncbi:MAG TPA: adenylate/guanylate cyclase domain-containing protein [Thermoanaerobaculia bacterium]|nr:adenylate/guanylate cyclase domain-containing protein [Thermoanaerobaculia bacterium]